MSSPLPAFLSVRKPAHRTRTAAAAVLTAILFASFGHAPAALAAEPKPAAPTAKPVPVIPVKAVKAHPADAGKQPPPASARPAPVWPLAAHEVIEVPAAGEPARSAKTSPVRIAPPAAASVGRSAQSVPTRVRAEVLDRAATARAGVRGLVLGLTRSDGTATAGPTTVTVDYRSFASAYGADWSSRLRLISLPACALTTPAKQECAATPLASRNDAKAKTVSADVAISGTRTLVAAEAAASGPAGDYAASSLSASSTWTAGGNTGSFNWSYPMRVPPALGGPAPQIGLSYSSQSVDGRHAASNNQPSEIGEGFEASGGGFVERRYIPCADDMNGSANNDKKTGDLCWETDNATLSLAGHSGELIYNSAQSRWHLRGDDGSRIERKTGATNDDNNGEHWVLTTTSGVQYWFGLNRLPGWTAGKPVTNSTLNVPVFGNDPNEPCHETAFADSDCPQAWRWNLDYVVDTSGNSMSYWYGEKETNKYGRNLKAEDDTSYDRASWLDHIDYGTRKINGTDSVLNTLAPMRADFAVDNRCLTNCGTHDEAHWPDVPWDSSCTGDSCTDNFTPTFWSTKRLSGVTTQVRNGAGYRNVERWTLTHTFPDPGDGTRAGMWLSKLSHTGLVGGSATVPDILFTPVQKPNRVDTIDFAAAMNWMRIARIRTDSGGTISVNYTDQDCQANEARPNPATNTRLCYPVRWIPEGYENAVTDWFNKYLVKTIYEQDNTGGTPPNGSPRVVYSYDYFDGAAWHYADDDGLIKKNYKTWSDYRGYGRVGVTVGDPGEQTYSETRFFRGMNGDRLNSAGGTKPVSVDGIADDDWFAGMTREAKVLNGPNGGVVSRTLNTPWASGPTASRTINGDTVTARFTGTGTTASHVTLDGGRGEQISKTVTTFDANGMPEIVEELGVDGTLGDEQCTKNDYTPRNLDAWILDRVHRVQTYAVKCADVVGTLTEDKIIGETRTSFDGQAFEAVPQRGLATKSEVIADWNGGAPTFTVQGRDAYDAHGRVTSTWDALDKLTNIAYTPATDGPVTATLTKNPLLHETEATIEPAWGTTLSTVDPNDKVTATAYDPLGRLTSVWKPGRAKDTDTPHIKYGYEQSADVPTVVSTSALNAAGTYVTSYTLYDGLMRSRQTQSPSPSGGRILTEAFYDSAGRAVLSFGGYHTSGNPGGTLLTATDKAFVPKQNRTVYDGAGRVTANVFQPYGAERWRMTTAYGGDRTDVTPPPGGTATSTVVDARGRTVQLRQYHGSAPSPYAAGTWDATDYSFDRRGFQTRIADALGNDWTYKYNIRGQQIEIDDPDRGITSYTYDKVGNVLTATSAGKTIAYLYDPLGRKRAAYDSQLGGPLRAQWVYDTVATGQLSQSTRLVGSATYQLKVLDYSDNYQPGSTQVIIPASETGLAGTYNFTTTYNVDGSVKTSSIPSTNSDLQPETLTYGYSGLGQPMTINSLYGTQNLSYIADADYNALGELEQVEMYTGSGGRVFTSYQREPETGRLTNIHTYRDSVAPHVLSDTGYKHDAAGKIIKSVNAAPGREETQCFGYDNLARLSQAWTPSGGDCATAPSATALGGPAPYWHSWQFNAVGNRTQEVVHSATGNATTDYTYPASGSTTTRPHAVTAVAGARTGSFTYDANGNMLTRPTPSAGTQTMTWDPEGHLATSTDATGATSYIYDADGNRLIRRDPTGRTLYLAGQEIRYTTSTATKNCTRYYSFAGSTVASRSNAGIQWLSSDHQGTASIAVNAATQQETIRRQTPYGVARGPDAAWPNSKGFVGGTIDNTGLTHLGAREYDPALGRFISVDPIQDLADPQQWNGYAYANNNPVSSSDASGLMVDTGNGSGNGQRINPKNNQVLDKGNNGNTKGYSKRYGRNGTVTKVYANGKKTINGVTPRAGGPDIHALAAGVDRARGDYRNLEWCTTACEYDTIDMIFNACALKYVECSDSYIAKVQLDRAIAMCIDIGCGNKGGGGKAALKKKAAYKKLKGDDDSCEAGYNSFGADTEVLMSDGSRKKFADLKRGDEVLATDPETGDHGPRRIEAVWVHQDDLYELTVDGEPIVTTEDHPFWNETDRSWQDAQELDRGDQIRTPTGLATVDGFDSSVHRYAAAYNLTVADIHTYYVFAGRDPVLVHNCQVAYGSTELSGLAAEYRLKNDIGADNNILAVKVEGEEEPRFYTATRGVHSEKYMDDDFKGKEGLVKEIYSERVPCDRRTCMPTLSSRYDHAPVSWSFPGGTNITKGMAREAVRRWQHDGGLF